MAVESGAGEAGGSVRHAWQQQTAAIELPADQA